MSAVMLNEAVSQTLRDLAIHDLNELVTDYLATEILARISDFSQEVEHFQAKYHQPLHAFKTQYERGAEDFERYDDLMAWEFAQQGKTYWEQRLERLRHVL